MHVEQEEEKVVVNPMEKGEIKKGNLPFKLFTYQLTENGAQVAADSDGMAIPIKLSDNYPFQIPVYINTSPHHEQSALCFDGIMYAIEKYVQLETHINIFVLPLGPFNPKAPICAG